MENSHYFQAVISDSFIFHLFYNKNVVYLSKARET